MTASAGKGRLLEAGGLTITIAGPIRMALNVALPEQLDKGNVVTDVALVEAPALPASSERREPDREPGEPERDAEEDVYGENGEKKPYHPARPRRPRSGEQAGAPSDRAVASGPVCRTAGHAT